MKKFFQIAAWVIVIGVIIVGWQVRAKNESKIKSTEQAREESAKQAEQTRKETIHKAIIELANKHNAVVNWKEPLSKIESYVFTMEVEDALLRKDNRPVLFLATVLDVERKENKYLLHFLVEDLEGLSVIKFVLDSSDEQVKKITQQQFEDRLSEKFAVIAEIQKVRRVVFNLKAEIDSEEPVIRVVTTDSIFIVSGKCLDLLFVGDYSDYDLYPGDKGE